jgi:hypothetical protein
MLVGGLKKMFGRDNMGKGLGRIWLRLLVIFCVTIAVFVLLLTLVMFIPNSAIEENYNASMEVFEEEGDGWKRMFNNASGSMLDNLTDRIIICGTMVNEDCSAISNAMSGNGYSRYWHGYLVWVRPLLLVFTYLDIRYILMLVFMMLFAANVLGMSRRLGAGVAYVYAFCLGLAYFIMVPWSLQFCEVFLIMMGTTLFFLRKYDVSWKISLVGEIFLVIGLVTQYLDFLTAPLLTLGLPLCVLLLINAAQMGGKAVLRSWAMAIHSCITWAFGWGVGWAAKWIVGTVVLGRDRGIIEDALSQAAFRVNGNAASKASRVTAIVKNAYTMLPFSSVIGNGERLAMVLVGLVYLVVLVAVLALWVRRRKRGAWKAYLPVVFVAALPVLWFVVMAQHSQVHFFYTYRIQMISYFGIMSSFVCCIRWKDGDVA